jgi:transcriptional regulator GlxA family with amidase domain
MTRIQYQKHIRLHEARAPLLAVGYDSPSQFSRKCRRMFGVPPSRASPTR